MFRKITPLCLFGMFISSHLENFLSSTRQISLDFAILSDFNVRMSTGNIANHR